MEGHAEPLKYPKANRASFYTIGRILEGIFRSLNNLLERFHQSYFFYLLPASNRFISIGQFICSEKNFIVNFFCLFIAGLYMPCICLVIGTLFIKACAHWYQLQDADSGKRIKLTFKPGFWHVFLIMLIILNQEATKKINF